jgi:hypothetical protein
MPDDFNHFNFSIATSTSLALGSGSAGYISVCLIPPHSTADISTPVKKADDPQVDHPSHPLSDLGWLPFLNSVMP